MSHRKAIYVNILLHQITNFVESSISFSYKISTVMNYFDFNIEFTDEEAKSFATIAYCTAFDITSLMVSWSRFRQLI